MANPIFVKTVDSYIAAITKVALNIAPGYTYMTQFRSLVNENGGGATGLQKLGSALANYASTDNAVFASALVANLGITGDTATTATANVTAMLNSYGADRGKALVQLVDIMVALQNDATWGAAANTFVNSVNAGYQYSVNPANTSQDLTVLAAAVVVDPANALVGQTFTLTAAADQVPGLLGSSGMTASNLNDTYVVTDTTLSSGDKIVDAGGSADKLKYSAQAAATEAAFEMSGVETIEVTADQTQPVSFDLSGTLGLNLLKALNATGDITFTQVTTEADIEVNNVTQGADVTVSYQDGVAAGANDVGLLLANNSNVTPVGVITVGRTADANGGIETISATVSGAASTVTKLDSDITKLNVAGNQNLTVLEALNATVRTVDAKDFTGSLNINLTGDTATIGANGLTVTTNTGNDVVDMLNGSASGTVAEAYDLATVTGDVTITTGAGNDTVEAGLGDDNISLGDGNDLLVMTANGLTVADVVVGGIGMDQLTLNTTDTISKSEAERVTQIETVNLLASGSTFVVTDNLLTTADGGVFTINTNNGTTAQLTNGGHTIDLTNVSFKNTGSFALTGQGLVAATTTAPAQIGTADTVIADDATVNAKAILAFGQDGFLAAANNRVGDTLKIVDGGMYTADDFKNVSGLDNILLTASTTIAQTYNIELLSAMIDNYDSGNNLVGDTLDELVIMVDRNVPQGSVVNINAAQVGANQRVTVYSNANVTVNLTNNTAGRVTVLSSLEYTENSDNLVGTGGDDLFTADSLDQIDTADLATGFGQVAGDTLRLDFAVHNAAQNLIGAQLNATGISGIEVITFNTASNVAFTDDTAAGNTTTGVVTFNTGAGNDTINASGVLNNTYNMGAGNNTWNSSVFDTNNVVTTTGTGVNTITFAADAITNGTTLTAADSVSTGTTGNNDSLVINDGAGTGAVFALPNVIVGVDNIAYTAGDVGDGLLVDNVDVNTADDGETNFTVSDANVGNNTVAVFDATALTATPTHLNTANVTVLSAPGELGLATNAADVLGGADNDTIVLSATLGGLGGGYVVQGNAGADNIAIGANPIGVIVNFSTANDGGAQGQSTGYDVVTGFTSGTDVIGFSNNLIESVFQTTAARTAIAANADAGNAALAGGAGAVGRMVVVADSAVNFNNAQDALVITQIGGGVTDAGLTDLLAISQKANVLGVTAAATDGGIIVVQGATQSMVYLYVEQDGTANNVAANELKILGQFDGAVVGTDLWVI